MEKQAFDMIMNGAAHGDVARRLMSANMNVGALRSYIAKEDNKPYVSVNGQAVPIANATLQYDEWKEIDRVVSKAGRSRLNLTQFLISKGLELRLGNGLASTVLQSQNANDISAAELSMAGDKNGKQDRPNFETVYLPLPIAHKDFELSIRVLESSRKNGDGLDLFVAELAARKVAELIEDMVINGASYTFGGGSIAGLTTQSSRNTQTMGTAWASDTGENILFDILTARDTLHADNHHGPYALICSTNCEKPLDSDFKAASDLTLRQRIKEVGGIEEVLVCDGLTASHAVLFELTPEVVRIVNGLELTTVEWETKGGMIFNFKVMAIMVPQVRADQDGKSGIVHISGT